MPHLSLNMNINAESSGFLVGGGGTVLEDGGEVVMKSFVLQAPGEPAQNHLKPELGSRGSSGPALFSAASAQGDPME